MNPTPAPSQVPPHTPAESAQTPYVPKEDWLYKLLGPQGKKKLLHQHRVRTRAA